MVMPRCIYSIILLLYTCFNPIQSELVSDNVEIAINCGGDQYIDSKNIQYQADNYFSGGQSSDFGTQFEIKMSHDGEPYKTERWSETDFTYSIPLSQDGKFVIILKFSEVYFNSSGDKVFDVALGKTKIVKELDIYSKVGKSTAYDEYIEIELKNNKVYHDGKPVDSAWNEENRSLAIVFQKGERDNPKINAILVVRGDLQNTDYEAFKSQLEELEKDRMEKERKQREIKKRNNLHYDFEDFEDDFVDEEAEAKRSSNLTNPVFLTVSGLILVFLYLMFFKSSSERDEKED